MEILKDLKDFGKTKQGWTCFNFSASDSDLALKHHPGEKFFFNTV